MLKKTFKYFILSLLLFIITIVFIIEIKGNFYEVNEQVYRSGQLNKYNLEYYIKEKKLKSIINLRGFSTEDFHKDEKALSDKYNIQHIDYELSNSDFLDYTKAKELVSILKNAEKPLLIHCYGGADRTALASALYQYGVAKTSVNEAKDEFTIFYGHAPFFRKEVIAMDKSFDNYVKSEKEKDE
jgi:protein tyrosine/serine phosphatase